MESGTISVVGLLFPYCNYQLSPSAPSQNQGASAQDHGGRDGFERCTPGPREPILSTVTFLALVDSRAAGFMWSTFVHKRVEVQPAPLICGEGNGHSEQCRKRLHAHKKHISAQRYDEGWWCDSATRHSTDKFHYSRISVVGGADSVQRQLHEVTAINATGPTRIGSRGSRGFGSSGICRKSPLSMGRVGSAASAPYLLLRRSLSTAYLPLRCST
jgi:hypothetical protein